MTRPSFDEYWMDIARVVATRSTCIRRQIGAVITIDNLVVATGYNGSCSKLENCSDIQQCLRDEQCIPSGTNLDIDHAVHAEQNAIINSPIALRFIPQHKTMFVTTYPCPICAKLIVQSKINRIVCYSPYSNQTAMELFAASGVEVCWVNQTADYQ